MKILDGKIDHIHCYVKDLDKAIEFFSKVLGTKFTAPFTLTDWKVRGAMDPLGLELGQPLAPDSMISAEIEEKGEEGIFAVSFLVENLDEAVAEMQSYGLKVIRRYEVPGVLRDALFDPRDSFGIAIELTEHGSLYGATFEAGLEAGLKGEESILEANFDQEWSGTT